MDSKEVFGVRRQAGNALANLNGEDWPKLIDDLRVQGDTEAKRLAFELMQEIRYPAFSDAQVVQVILAYDGLTALPWPRRSGGGLAVRFWRFADGVPIDHIDGILDTLTAYVRELLPKYAGIEEHDLIGLAYKLILRRLEASSVDPHRLWAWLSPYPDYPSEDQNEIEDLAKNERRRSEGHPVECALGWLREADLAQVNSIYRGYRPGLTPNESDVVALLGALDPTDRADMRWRDMLGLIRHEGDTGAAARDAAMPFVRTTHNSAVGSTGSPNRVYRNGKSSKRRKHGSGRQSGRRNSLSIVAILSRT